MTARLDLKPRHRKQLESLLSEHLPGVEVWAYGSRVSGMSHEGSDLDLVLRGPGLEPKAAGKLSQLTDALRESTLPFLVGGARLGASAAELPRGDRAQLRGSDV